MEAVGVILSGGGDLEDLRRYIATGVAVGDPNSGEPAISSEDILDVLDTYLNESSGTSASLLADSRATRDPLFYFDTPNVQRDKATVRTTVSGSPLAFIVTLQKSGKGWLISGLDVDRTSAPGSSNSSLVPKWEGTWDVVGPSKPPGSFEITFRRDAQGGLSGSKVNITSGNFGCYHTGTVNWGGMARAPPGGRLLARPRCEFG